jgi:hypothetical protein
MKTKLFTLLLFLGYLSYAQLHIDTGVASQTNTAFSLLELNRVPNNLLLDYGYDFVSVPNYDGVLRTNNYLTPAIYRDLYNSIVSSRTTTTVPELVAPDAMENTWSVFTKSENNRVGKGSSTTALVANGLYYTYSRFSANALSTNKIKIVGGKYDDSYVSGIWQNPYETKEAFGITLPQRKVTNSKIAILLHADTWFTNNQASIQNLAIDFGAGAGYTTLTLGTPLNYTYAADGVYTITYRVQLTNGQYRYCRNKLEVTGAATQNSLTARNVNCGRPTVVPIAGTRAYLGTAGSATLQIAYAGTCNQITKPLIVVEGFDTGFVNGGQFGDTDIFNFLELVRESGSTELQNLITSTTSTVDYDIIYVNWDNGTDFLQRNAYVLEDVIKWVNANKVGTTPNVVLGQSMGGVIARYALRDMENRSEPHNTSLYISQDAPHQGAHVPPSLLYFARHALNEVITTPVGAISIALAGGDIPVNEAKQLIDRPAVKQLLKNWVNTSYTIDSTAHTTWLNELKTMGYPQNTRNVALSNASHCANTQGLFLLNGSAATSPITELVLFFTGLGVVPGALLGDTSATLLGFLPGASKISTNFEAKTFPSSGVANIYNGSITYTKTLLWLVPITRTVTNRSFNSPTGALFLDNFPGGVNPSGSTIQNNSAYVTNFFAGYNYNLEANLNFGFIPAPSALDVGSGNAVLTASDYTSIYSKASPPTGTKTIPFTNFTTSFNTTGNNSIHLSFQRANADWLASEMDATPGANTFDCSFVCANQSITGPEAICTSGTFTIGTASATWSISPSTAATFLAGNSASKTFTKMGTFRGNATITATINSSACGAPVVITKQVFFGLPFATAPTGPDLCINIRGGEEIYVLPVSAGATSYTLSSSSPNFRINGGTSSFTTSVAPLNIRFRTTVPGNYTVTLTTTNACGSTATNFTVVARNCSTGGGRDRMYMVYPNPVDTELNIAINDTLLNVSSFQKTDSNENIVLQKEVPFIIILHDFEGRLVKQQQFSKLGDIQKVEVSDLKKGIYFLKIIARELEETHRIIIE